MYQKVNLLTNGKIKNYPSSILMKWMKVKHWTELIMANNESQDAFEDIFTSVFDDLIDWDRVEFINTTDQLTQPDRLKLFFLQQINCRYDDYTLDYTCSKCKEKTTNTFFVSKQQEQLIKKEVEETVIIDEIDNKEIFISLHIPLRSDIDIKDQFVYNYKTKVFEEIDELLFITDQEKLLMDLEKVNIKKTKEWYKNLQHQAKEKNIDKDNLTPENLIEIKKLTQENPIQIQITNINKRLKECDEESEKNIDKVKDILNKNYLEVISEDGKINSINDINFISVIQEYIDYFHIIDNKYRDENYLDFIQNLSMLSIKQMREYLITIIHGYKNKLKLECHSCGYKEQVEYPLPPQFFFPN